MRYSARVQILTGYAGLARSLGVQPEEMAQSVGLDLSRLHELDARIPAAAFGELLERTAKETGVEDVGLKLAESRELGILGPIGIVVHQQPDVRSAIQSLCRYLPCHNEALHLWLDESDGLALLHLQVRTGGRQVTELSLGAFHRIVRRLAGPHWRAVWVCFEHQGPARSAAYRRFFGCPVDFSADHTCITFNAASLDTPLATSDQMLVLYAQRYLESSMPESELTIDAKIRELIRLLIFSGGCSADKVARGLGVDRRTVHRHLSARGLTFSMLLNDVRRELVVQMLQSSRSIADVADRLGFSCSPALSRWFKQEMGMSPAEWRRQSSGQVHAAVENPLERAVEPRMPRKTIEPGRAPGSGALR